MNLANIIEKQLSKKGMSKTVLHSKIKEIYIGEDFPGYISFSQRIRMNRLTTEELLYIALILDMDLNSLKGYLKKELLLNSKNKTNDSKLQNALYILNKNSLYIGENMDTANVCTSSPINLDDYKKLKYCINDIEKIDENSYMAVYTPNPNYEDSYLFCSEIITFNNDNTATIKGCGAQYEKWYVDILVNDGANLTYEEFYKLNLKEKNKILLEDLENITLAIGESLTSENSNYKRVINL